ncbi:MAG TPA: GTPase HflX [Candidatus Bathyarchaeota archaeon]|nr:GTPase HflX [Candidatus Bathyarchaeota archaeon]
MRRPRAIVVERRRPGERSHIDELRALAEAAGYEVVGQLEQVREPDPKYQIGPGKAEELADMVKKLKADIVIFENELKPVQAYNLAKLLGVEAIDRFQLILQIFAQRATTREAQLQVKLAALRYELVRAKEKVRLAKMGEQPGFMGLGKYEADVYYEMIKRQIATIRRKLERIRKKRQLHRKRREKMGLPSVSLSGYTNAGKSTLFYALTGEYVQISPSLFTTLTTTARLADFNGRSALLIDTVGFIDRLPIQLVEAFHSTLEETTLSDVILLVVDISEPIEEVERKLGCCLDTLAEIGAGEVPKVTALNKIDLLSSEEVSWRLDYISKLVERPVPISALYGTNLDELKAQVAELLPGYVKARVVMPLCDEAYSLASWAMDNTHVLKAEYGQDRVVLVLEGLEPLVGKLAGRVRELGGELELLRP